MDRTRYERETREGTKNEGAGKRYTTGRQSEVNMRLTPERRQGETGERQNDSHVLVATFPTSGVIVPLFLSPTRLIRSQHIK